MSASVKVEKRKRERKRVDQAILVRDTLLDTSVGRVVNMHEEGFLLISNNRIKENRLYQLSMRLPDGENQGDFLSVGAECLWMKETDAGTHFWAGFHIIDIADAARSRITEFISDLDC